MLEVVYATEEFNQKFQNRLCRERTAFPCKTTIWRVFGSMGLVAFAKSAL